MKRDTLLEIAVGLSAAAAVAALFAWSGHARGVEVYRCGNTYQDAPCAGGARLEIDPNTNLIQRETRVPTGAYDTIVPAGGAHLPNPLVKPEAPAPAAEPPRYHWPRPNPWIPVVPATRHLLERSHRHDDHRPPAPPHPPQSYRYLPPR